MTVSPNGKYIATLTKHGDIEITINEYGKRNSSISRIDFPNIKPQSNFTSGSFKWLNNGKLGY